MRVYILLFTTSSAFAAERALSSPLLLNFDFSLCLVPTPKEYSSNCGMSLLLEGGESLVDKELEAFWQCVDTILTQKNIHYQIQSINTL